MEAKDSCWHLRAVKVKKSLKLPTPEMLLQAWKKDGYSMVEVLPDDQLALRVLIPVKSALWKDERRTLQFMQPVPKQIAEDAETVQAVYRDYQELSLSRLGLKRLYGITLTLSLLIVLLSVSSAAFYLSEQLSAPLGGTGRGNAGCCARAISPATTRYKAGMNWAR